MTIESTPKTLYNDSRSVHKVHRVFNFCSLTFAFLASCVKFHLSEWTHYSIFRFDRDAEIPRWVFSSEFFSLIKTQDELSLVVRNNDLISDDIPCSKKATDKGEIPLLPPLDSKQIPKSNYCQRGQGYYQVDRKMFTDPGGCKPLCNNLSPVFPFFEASLRE